MSFKGKFAKPPHQADLALPSDWLASLSATGEIHNYPTGRIFIREGEPERAIYILARIIHELSSPSGIRRFLGENLPAPSPNGYENPLNGCLQAAPRCIDAFAGPEMTIYRRAPPWRVRQIR